MKGTITDSRGRPLKLISLEKRVALRRLYVAQMPSWRHPLAGYLAVVPLVALGMGAVLLMKNLFSNNFYFPDTPMMLAVLVVALFWGVGPALFAVLLGALALDYFYIPPVMQFTIPHWDCILQMLTFVVLGLVFAIITSQRKCA